MSEVQSVAVALSIYSLGTRSTVDKPEYKFNSMHEFVLETTAFSSLRHLHEELIAHTPAGFLRSQFFRLALLANFKFNMFLSSDELVRYVDVYDMYNKVVDLVLVRYTRPQANYLKDKVSPDELLILDSVLRYKRKYNRIIVPYESKPNARRAQCAAVVSDCYNFRYTLSGVASEIACLTDFSTAQCECAARCALGSTLGMSGIVYARYMRNVQFNENTPGGFRTVQMEVPSDILGEVQRFIGEKILLAQGIRLEDRQ